VKPVHVQVILIEAAIIVLLWIVGRVFD